MVRCCDLMVTFVLKLSRFLLIAVMLLCWKLFWVLLCSTLQLSEALLREPLLHSTLRGAIVRPWTHVWQQRLQLQAGGADG